MRTTSRGSQLPSTFPKAAVATAVGVMTLLSIMYGDDARQVAMRTQTQDALSTRTLADAE